MHPAPPWNEFTTHLSAPKLENEGLECMCGLEALIPTRIHCLSGFPNSPNSQKNYRSSTVTTKPMLAAFNLPDVNARFDCIHEFAKTRDSRAAGLASRHPCTGDHRLCTNTKLRLSSKSRYTFKLTKRREGRHRVAIKRFRPSIFSWQSSCGRASDSPNTKTRAHSSA